MDFVFEERRLARRECSHTIVFDRDPDFEFISAIGGTFVIHIVRIWLVTETSPEKAKRSAYVGSVRFSPRSRPSLEEITRVLRGAESAARHLGTSFSPRRRLLRFLSIYSTRFRTMEGPLSCGVRA